jgi:pyruvoyl-dependent arginine decarboxylase (PvlArgDC)
MKRIIANLSLILVLTTTSISAQTTLKEYKVGHVVNVSLPDYMSKTMGLNSSSILQYKSTVKDVYGFIIEDNKEELTLVEMNYSSINEFCEDFAKDFLKDEKKKTFTYPEYKKIADINFAEFDASYYDKEAKGEIYYLVGIVETKTSYYKVISYTSLENKDKFKADFQKILYSLND